MKKLLSHFLILFTICMSLNNNAQTTYVPDDDFETYIENSYPAASDGTLNNNYVKTVPLSTINLIMPTPSQYQISDFTGLQAFTSLLYLYLDGQTMSSLDISSLTHAPNIQITVKNCNSLVLLKLPGGDISHCGIESNAILKTAHFKPNCHIKELWIKNNNMLDSINISQIGYLLGGADLDVINNPVLSYFNMANSYCSNWTTVTFMGNPSLYCIIVDNPTFSNNAPWYWDYKPQNPNLYKYVDISTNCTVTGIKHIALAQDYFNAFPNPSTGQFTFDGLSDNCSIEVTDLAGRIIYTGQLAGSERSINLHGKSKGIYIYKITTNENRISQGKLILE